MKQYLVTAGIALVVVVIGLVFFGPKPNIVNQTLGAVTGPDSSFPVETHNGIATYFFQGALNTASTTQFVIKSPGATTTLDLAQCVGLTGNAAALTYNITKGTGMQSSTTALSNNISVSAAATGVVVASSSLIDSVRTINPNTFIQFNAFGSQGLAAITGRCSIRLTAF